MPEQVDSMGQSYGTPYDLQAKLVLTVQEHLLLDLYRDCANPDASKVSQKPGSFKADYYNHAFVTADLINHDPTFEYGFALNDKGQPAVREANNQLELFGWLRVHGVTRWGVGYCPVAQQEPMKHLISDFLKNTAMRFGIALGLWAKGDLDTDATRSHSDHASDGADVDGKPASAPPKPSMHERLTDTRINSEPPLRAGSEADKLVSDAQINYMKGLAERLDRKENLLEWITEFLGYEVADLAALSMNTGRRVIEQFKEELEAAA